uniref:Uncharacterized protein n=1 Tax=Plectus sambesii TaxID=2011161 RepID=A0A914WV37_9BILA
MAKKNKKRKASPESSPSEQSEVEEQSSSTSTRSSSSSETRRKKRKRGSAKAARSSGTTSRDSINVHSIKGGKGGVKIGGGDVKNVKSDKSSRQRSSISNSGDNNSSTHINAKKVIINQHEDAATQPSPGPSRPHTGNLKQVLTK